MLLLVHILAVFVVLAQGRKGVGDVEQDWGYITIRPHAHMFWWLYYTTYNVSSYTERPLIIWLQGGPGMSSTGYGNFLEIGPLNASLHKREGSFVENYNVLFIDNPLEAGYSYISDYDKADIVHSGEDIGEDLYNFLKIFLNTTHNEFKNVPIYIFGESYGGKMAVEIAYTLTKKEKLCNLKGIGLGDAFISPMDYFDHYGPLSHALGLIDTKTYNEMNIMTKEAHDFIKDGDFESANIFWGAILNRFVMVDLYNFLDEVGKNKTSDLLDNLMNGEVKETLNIPAHVTWKLENFDEKNNRRIGDFMKSVTPKVEALLNSTDIKIIVYNGILDFIVNTAGTIAWLNNLNWKGGAQWLNTKQDYLVMDDVWEAHYKKVDNLAFYAILRAGHSVPTDNLRVINKILQLELD